MPALGGEEGANVSSASSRTFRWMSPASMTSTSIEWHPSVPTMHLARVNVVTRVG